MNMIRASWGRFSRLRSGELHSLPPKTAPGPNGPLRQPVLCLKKNSGRQNGDKVTAIGHTSVLSSPQAGLLARAAVKCVSEAMGSNGKQPVLERTRP